MKRFLLSILGLAALAVVPSLRAQTPSSANPLFQQPHYPAGVNPSLYPLNTNLYEWKIKDSNPVTESCRYDEPSGMWVGDCTGSLSAPGFSITVPRSIRR